MWLRTASPAPERVVGAAAQGRLVAGGAAGATEEMWRGSDNTKAGGGQTLETGEGTEEPGRVAGWRQQQQGAEAAAVQLSAMHTWHSCTPLDTE